MIDLSPPPYTPPVEVDLAYNAKNPIVACVWHGKKYGPEYVLRLAQAVQRNMSIPYDFVVFADEANVREYGSLITEAGFGATFHPRAVTYPGWWSKLEMFDHQNWTPFDRILFLDLDVVITGSLTDFFLADHHTTMIANFGVNFRHAKYNSSVVCWDGQGPAVRIWDEFTNTGPAHVMKTLHGDQCFMWRVLVDDVRTWPAHWCVSYKYEVRRNHKLDPDTRTVVFHGDPKPDVVNDAFVVENWLHQ